MNKSLFSGFLTRFGAYSRIQSISVPTNLGLRIRIPTWTILDPDPRTIFFIYSLLQTYKFSEHLDSGFWILIGATVADPDPVFKFWRIQLRSEQQGLNPSKIELIMQYSDINYNNLYVERKKLKLNFIKSKLGEFCLFSRIGLGSVF